MPSFSKVALALLLATSVAALPTPQLHGEGVAADAVFTDTDNGVGYGTENAEDNIAQNIQGLRGGMAAGRHAVLVSRQMDKVTKGAQQISPAAGTGGETESTTTGLVNIDGDSTNMSADLGTDAGASEEQMLEDTGSAVPKI